MSDMTLGEIGRRLLDLKGDVARLSQQVQEVLVPLTEHGVKIEELEKKLGLMDEDLKQVVAKSAYVAGGISVMAFIGSLIHWPWTKP